MHRLTETSSTSQSLRSCFQYLSGASQKFWYTCAFPPFTCGEGVELEDETPAEGSDPEACAFPSDAMYADFRSGVARGCGCGASGSRETVLILSAHNNGIRTYSTAASLQSG